MRKIADIFDFLSSHRSTRAVSLCVLSVLFAFLVSTLHFSEDISDFLPLGTSERECMDIYQNISGADRILILFSNRDDGYETIDAIDSFVAALDETDSGGWCENLVYQFDSDDIEEVSSFVYEHIPYFLTDSDFDRMDSLLDTPGFIEDRLRDDLAALSFPTSSFAAAGISRDPLGLFSPVMQRLGSSGFNMNFETIDGYIFTPDKSRAIAMLTSPFGSSETQNNSKLLALLENASKKAVEEHPDVSIDITGGPAIAVGNSDRIKKDSILAISLSAALIVILLVYSFHSLRNILLILLSVGWGLLFALGGIAMFKDEVSIIVIGISSVILGIAVNYPLHLIAHSYHQGDRRECLKEICSPLIIGNITTVGAFLALIPLKSSALRDLGLFAALLLLGTIIFVLIYLPHYIKPLPHADRKSAFNALSGFSPEKNRVVVCLAAALTLLLAYFSLSTGFDSDMTHINYMTKAQKEDMQYFEDLLTKDSTHTAGTIFVYGKGASFDEAATDIQRYSGIIDSLSSCGKITKQNEALSFLVPRKEQIHRLEKWKDFIGKHHSSLTGTLAACAAEMGFSDTAFEKFYDIAGSEPSGTLEEEDLKELTATVFARNTTRLEETGTSYIVCPLNVESGNAGSVKEAFPGHSFDIAGINASITGSLSDNFNYIGWVCSLIVFVFLWFSFGRAELAVISFLPMAVSWLWILGLMSILGIRFNIVNIILATFIFGQGDDYTIFVTEGCQYDYSRRSSILASYKSSILKSAAIMFAGIGTLIVARHPAMKSLAEVTIIGMFSVVFMACLIPPLLFRILTTKNGKPRAYPLTFASILFGEPATPSAKVEGRYIYKGKEVEKAVRKSLKLHGADIPHISYGETFEYQDGGYGECALLMAYTHPSTNFKVHIPDDEKRRIALIAAEGFVSNIEFLN